MQLNIGSCMRSPTMTWFPIHWTTWSWRFSTPIAHNFLTGSGYSTLTEVNGWPLRLHYWHRDQLYAHFTTLHYKAFKKHVTCYFRKSVSMSMPRVGTMGPHCMQLQAKVTKQSCDCCSRTVRTSTLRVESMGPHCRKSRSNRATAAREPCGRQRSVWTLWDPTAWSFKARSRSNRATAARELCRGQRDFLRQLIVFCTWPCQTKNYISFRSQTSKSCSSLNSE
jgi:hypothetical protein